MIKTESTNWKVFILSKVAEFLKVLALRFIIVLTRHVIINLNFSNWWRFILISRTIPKYKCQSLILILILLDNDSEKKVAQGFYVCKENPNNLFSSLFVGHTERI